MPRFAYSPVFLMIAAYVLTATGCGPSAKPVDKKVTKAGGEEEHHHHHDHGPHNGHIAEFADDTYHVEWTHDDDTGKVNLYVLDGEAKKEVPIAAEDLVIVTKTGDETKEYTLSPVEPTDGKTARFEVVDKDLIGTLETLSEKITAEVKKIDVNGKSYENVKLASEDHHDH